MVSAIIAQAIGAGTLALPVDHHGRRVVRDDRDCAFHICALNAYFRPIPASESNYRIIVSSKCSTQEGQKKPQSLLFKLCENTLPVQSKNLTNYV